MSKWSPDRLKVSTTTTIVRDEHFIPHIFSQNKVDACTAQGYVEAVDRFWQMDFITRATAGRLSEIFGPRALEYDIGQRKKGLALAAKHTVEKWKKYPESFAFLEAYSRGVNAYVDQLQPADFPIEYKILGYAPEPWTEVKTALFFKYMSDILCSRENDLERHRVQGIIGEDLFGFLFGRRNQKDIPVIPTSYSDTVWNDVIRGSDERIERHDLGYRRPFEKSAPGLGSNNWAISPSKSATGRSILANDPHLQLKLPSIWYLVHIVTPEQNTFGVSFPGVPGIILGFNEHLAWGVTNVGHDVLDWHPVAVDSSAGKVQIGQDQLQGTWIIDTIRVAGSQDHYERILWTEHGPIWKLKGDSIETWALMKWVAHEAGDEDDLSVFPTVNEAKNVDEFLQAINKYESPAQNFVVATAEGDIALKVQGDLPLREHGKGSKFEPLLNENELWSEYIPDERLPLTVNPSQGYAASANQVSTDSTYPYRYFVGDHRSERGRTINEVLRAKNELNMEDMKALQMNSFHITAVEFVDIVKPFLEKQGQDGAFLLEWDGRHLAEAEAPTLFSIWFKTLRKFIFDEWNYLEDYVYPDMWVVLDLLENHHHHVLFDAVQTKDKRENAQDILALSWKEALAQWKSLKDQRWYKYRDTKIPHIIGQLEAFGIAEVKSDGTGKAPLALTSSTGPSWRLIHEPGGDRSALGIYPGGQSGHPGSPHYLDFFEKWRTGEYLDLHLYENAEEVKNNMEVITLVP